jgi:hypothetical protein
MIQPSTAFAAAAIADGSGGAAFSSSPLPGRAAGLIPFAAARYHFRTVPFQVAHVLRFLDSFELLEQGG